jgi:hypothetical protein
MGDGRGTYRVLGWRPDGKRPYGRRMRRWEGNIKMELQEMGWGVVDWINLAQDRDRWRTVINVLMYLRVP